MGMDISVVAAAREDDRPPQEALLVASLADQLGYREVWIGEGPTWDSFVLATAIGLATERIAVTAGPLPVSVRDPMTIARAAAGAAALIRRPVGVAIGTSSVRVVEGLHGRSRARAVNDLSTSAAAVRALTDHQRPEAMETILTGQGFRARLAPAGGLLTIAAFGDRAIAVAARHADRMLLDVVSPAQVGRLRAKLDAAAKEVDRTPPKLAAWLPTAIDPTPEAHTQLTRSLVGYLTVPGYREMFATAGFGDAVELAAGGADRDELVAALPEDAAQLVGIVGDAATMRERLDAYADAGLDEIAIVPATAGDVGGQRTLTAVAKLL
jgi:probable F420-dependent oxidoreductase